MLKWIKGGISAVTGIAEPEYGENYIHTVSKRLQNKQPYRPTTRDDFNWLAPEHTNVETVTFYFADLESGITGFAQIIHSCIMGLRTAAQFTFKIYTSNDPEDLNIWTSTKLKNFRIDGPNFYADGLSLELSEDNSSYHLVSTVCSKSEVDLVIKRLSPGAKCGDDPSTYYGDNVEEPWGSIRHVFWPRNFISGTIKVKKPVDVIDEDDEEEEEEGTDESQRGTEDEGNSEEEEDGEEEEEEEDDEEDYDEDYDEWEEEEVEDEDEEYIVYEDRTITFEEGHPVYCMYVMAMQGMKPHHAAKTWNFIYMHTKDYSSVVMEFTTPRSYANSKVSVGILATDDDVIMLTNDVDFQHLDAETDEVGWNVPKNVRVVLSGFGSKVTDEEIADGKVSDKDKVKVVLTAPLRSLVERVDVMGEIPQFVKHIVSGIAGTKPYIYQYSNSDFAVQVNGEEVEKGLGWCEVTFISESNISISEDKEDE